MVIRSSPDFTPSLGVEKLNELESTEKGQIFGLHVGI